MIQLKYFLIKTINWCYRKLVHNHLNHPDWGGFAQRLLDWRTNPRNGKKSDQAHRSIHPLKLTKGTPHFSLDFSSLEDMKWFQFFLQIYKETKSARKSVFTNYVSSFFGLREQRCNRFWDNSWCCYCRWAIYSNWIMYSRAKLLALYCRITIYNYIISANNKSKIKQIW